MALLPKQSPKEPMKKVNFRLPLAIVERLEEIGKESGHSPSSVVRALLLAGIAQYESENKPKRK